MKRNFLGRRASVGDQTMSFGWLFLMMFVAVGIVGGVILFFGSDIDIRGIESSQLAARVKGCIMSKNLEIGDALTLEKLASACKIDSKVISDVYVFSLYKGEKQLLNIGDSISCDFKGTEKNEYYPKCREERFSFEEVKYTIRVGSHQITRRELA